ncbi:anion permease [Alistipes sp.]|uniref:inorganic phosphate transporter n=1 Tax=Alistipes sp. TaxID=1872444 RepID=UPI003A88C731
MDPIYTAIIVILAVLAVTGLFVGVTNDAVNFLNSAVGSKAAPRRVILLVASAGILVGTLTSTGMMEVARNGMFDPAMFSFREVILLYLGVMFANIILLDLYNSWGLPTSTTVSLVFCLLGAAVAVSTYKIAGSDALTMGDLGEFIHSGRALGIVAAILLSVVIALTVGTAVMYVSRLIFSFRYTRALHRYGALWCGASLTAIVYFALFKGLKGTLAHTAFIHTVEERLPLWLLGCWLACSLLLFFIQRFRVNILRITILGGTFALALAFAGNDLVNFIGVPVAGWDAFRIARSAGDAAMPMDALNENVPANFAFLVGAGILMILTLWTSRKAMHVTETELSLASQNDEQEQREYGSSAFARAIVRATLSANHAIERVVPQRLRTAISRRFEVVDIEHTGAPFDMIRATVNLTTSALLIAVATSLKLPLSTTYVSFMVAMGSSLADRAWGRETAVYRISGVMTVVAGWFVTALGGFVIAYVVGLALVYGGTAALVALTALAGYMLVHSNFLKKDKTEAPAAVTHENVVEEIASVVGSTINTATRIYDRTLLAVFKENRKVLRDLNRESSELYERMHDRKYRMMSTLRALRGSDLDTAQYYVQVVDYLNELTKALTHIVRPAFDHIDNNHEGLTREQTADLIRVGDEVEAIYRRIDAMLATNDFGDIDLVLSMRDRLFETISDAIKSELRRFNDAGRGSTKASMLYLTILNETRTMVLQLRNLLKAQRHFLETKGVIKSWLYYAK